MDFDTFSDVYNGLTSSSSQLLFESERIYLEFIDQNPSEAIRYLIEIAKRRGEDGFRAIVYLGRIINMNAHQFLSSVSPKFDDFLFSNCVDFLSSEDLSLKFKYYIVYVINSLLSHIVQEGRGSELIESIFRLCLSDRLETVICCTDCVTGYIKKRIIMNDAAAVVDTIFRSNVEKFNTMDVFISTTKLIFEAYSNGVVATCYDDFLEVLMNNLEKLKINSTIPFLLALDGFICRKFSFFKHDKINDIIDFLISILEEGLSEKDKNLTLTVIIEMLSTDETCTIFIPDNLNDENDIRFGFFKRFTDVMIKSLISIDPQTVTTNEEDELSLISTFEQSSDLLFDIFNDKIENFEYYVIDVIKCLYANNTVQSIRTVFILISSCRKFLTARDFENFLSIYNVYLMSDNILIHSSLFESLYNSINENIDILRNFCPQFNQMFKKILSNGLVSSYIVKAYAVFIRNCDEKYVVKNLEYFPILFKRFSNGIDYDERANILQYFDTLLEHKEILSEEIIGCVAHVLQTCLNESCDLKCYCAKIILFHTDEFQESLIDMAIHLMMSIQVNNLINDEYIRYKDAVIKLFSSDLNVQTDVFLFNFLCVIENGPEVVNYTPGFDSMECATGFSSFNLRDSEFKVRVDADHLERYEFACRTLSSILVESQKQLISSEKFVTVISCGFRYSFIEDIMTDILDILVSLLVQCIDEKDFRPIIEIIKLINPANMTVNTIEKLCETMITLANASSTFNFDVSYFLLDNIKKICVILNVDRINGINTSAASLQLGKLISFYVTNHIDAYDFINNLVHENEPTYPTPSPCFVCSIGSFLTFRYDDNSKFIDTVVQSFYSDIIELCMAGAYILKTYYNRIHAGTVHLLYNAGLESISMVDTCYEIEKCEDFLSDVCIGCSKAFIFLELKEFDEFISAVIPTVTDLFEEDNISRYIDPVYYDILDLVVSNQINIFGIIDTKNIFKFVFHLLDNSNDNESMEKVSNIISFFNKTNSANDFITYISRKEVSAHKLEIIENMIT